MTIKTQKQSRLMKILTTPLKVLSKARDFYVKSMVGCAGRAGYGATADYPVAQFTSLPRSFSETSTRRSSDDEDMRELIRAASARTLGETRVESVNMVLQQREIMPQGLSKSNSVAVMGRIDEDSVCEFGYDDHVVGDPKLYPRSRSYAVGKRLYVF